MPIKKYTEEQVIGFLREEEILIADGDTIAKTSRKLGISEQSYYRWRKEYGGMKVVHAKRLKDLEKENGRLKGTSWRSASFLSYFSFSTNFDFEHVNRVHLLPGDKLSERKERHALFFKITHGCNHRFNQWVCVYKHSVAAG